METRKLTKTEGEILNCIRKFLDSLKGKSGITNAWFCAGSQKTCGGCKDGKCSMFYKGSMRKMKPWRPSFLLDLLAGNVKIVVSTGIRDELHRPDGNSVFIDFSKREWWFSRERNSNSYTYWSNMSVTNIEEDKSPKPYPPNHEKFMQSIADNIDKLFDNLQKYHHVQRGRIHSRDFGI